MNQMQGEQPTRIRPTARIILLDGAGRILLFKFEEIVPLDPDNPALLAYWLTPGGGVEPGESYEAAAVRELWEETGLHIDAPGPCVWTRSRTLRFADETVEFRERYFVVPATTTEISVANFTAEEHSVYRDHRWWSSAEIARSPDHFVPPGIAELLAPLAMGTFPTVPVHLTE